MSDKPRTDTMPILRTQGLTKRFGGLVAVSEVSLDLHVGEVHVVIGPNGAGKSTLTNLLSGDLPPTSGR
jgi:ABC-type branched-subunit amino acid transport system ATPase component